MSDKLGVFRLTAPSEYQLLVNLFSEAKMFLRVNLKDREGLELAVERLEVFYRSQNLEELRDGTDGTRKANKPDEEPV